MSFIWCSFSVSLQVNSPSCKVTPTPLILSHPGTITPLPLRSGWDSSETQCDLRYNQKSKHRPPFRQLHAPVSLLLFSFCACACFYPITISWRLCSVSMCHAEAFMRPFFVSSICLLLFVCEDNCLQIVADNLLLCIIFLLPTAILSSKESLIMIFRFSQWKLWNRNRLM